MNVLLSTPLLVSQPEVLGAHLPPIEIMDTPDHITDTVGVPLSSDRSALSEGTDFKYKRCPFTDSPSRSEADQVISGLELERLEETYGQLRRLMLASRASYLAVTESVADRKLQIIDGINILSFMQFLPVYLVLRSENPVPKQGSMPKHIIVGANGAGGAIGALGAYAEVQLIDKPDASAQEKATLYLPNGEAANEAVEQRGSLIGEKTSCVASSKMIKRFINLLREGRNIGFGDILTETDGLLSNEDFAKALIFGSRMEELKASTSKITDIAARHQPLIDKQKSRRHNQLGIARAMATQRAEVAPLVVRCLAINTQLNVCLDRESSPV